MIFDSNRIIDTEGNINSRELKNALQNMADSINANLWSKFKGDVITITTDSAVTKKNYSHNLKFIPNTCIILMKTPDTTVVSINYSLNTNQYINVTTSADADIKVLIGRFDL